MIGWIDGGAGASGDMLLGAFFGVGVPVEVVQSSLESLNLGLEIRVESVTRGGLGATKVHIEAPEIATVRHLADILILLEVLDEPVRAIATDVFERLAVAEAAVHQMPIDHVHFHEVGALDSIADVVGVAAAIVDLGLGHLSCSTLSLGRGAGRGAHGPLPVPVPAVLELLEPHVPVQAGEAPFESTTPTGAALLMSTVDSWGNLPAMTVTATGTGAGTRDSDEVANVVRLVIGEPAAATGGEKGVQFEANVDDLDPRVWPEAIAAVLGAGAQDAWVTPITMKKGRPAVTFSALCAPTAAPSVRHAIFRETSTIGLRETLITKHPLDRVETAVEVDGQRIGVKIASHGGVVANRSVEWDDVAAAAHALGRPAKQVLAEATGLAAEAG